MNIDITAVVVAVMIGSATYMMLTGKLRQIIIGVCLFSNAINLLILAASKTPENKRVPIINPAQEIPYVDPLPQALILTAIVIGFALISYIVVLSWRIFANTGEEDTIVICQEFTQKP